MPPRAPRVKQQEVIEKCLAQRSLPWEERSSVFALLHPGYGKELLTLMIHQAVAAAYPGEVVKTLHLAPRIGLCSQLEKKFPKYKNDFGLTNIQDVRWVEANKAPLFVPDADVYTASFQLVARCAKEPATLSLWQNAIMMNADRLILIVDECHLVGRGIEGLNDEDLGVEGLQVANALDLIFENKPMLTVLMTGTAVRADGRDIWGTEEHHIRRFMSPTGDRLKEYLPDVVGGFHGALEERALVPFTGQLVEGSVQTMVNGSLSKTDLISEIREGLRRVLADDAVRDKILRKFCQELRNQKSTRHQDIGGIVWADSTRVDYPDIVRRIQEIDPGLRVMTVAHSDSDAIQKLAIARRPGAIDVLVTIRMASIGFDGPSYFVGANLSPDRTDASENQRWFRLGRTWLDSEGNPVIPWEKQRMHCIGLDDEFTRMLFEKLRRDTAIVLGADWEEKLVPPPPPRPPPPPINVIETVVQPHDIFGIDGWNARGDALDAFTKVAHHVHDNFHPDTPVDILLSALVHAQEFAAQEALASAQGPSSNETQALVTIDEPRSEYIKRQSKVQEEKVKTVLQQRYGYAWVRGMDDTQQRQWRRKKASLTAQVDEMTLRQGGVKDTRDWWEIRDQVINALIKGAWSAKL